ncbi:MAG: zinc ribbon domain-containing protein [Eubacteriales bacterium]|nr:zinc ribbon domain-containing protein [Eubacteriales bacterium]
MAIKLEKIVQTFYEALEDGRMLGRKCPKCGNVEFPPVYACNACGSYETQWYEISGKAKMHSIVLPAALSSKPEYKNMGKFAYGEIELEEGTRLNGVVRGISKKNREELMAKLPLNVHAVIFQREAGFKTVIFELDEEYGVSL